jgi:hypothetical protein
VGVGADAGSGAGDLLVIGEFDVVHRVVADLVPFGEDLAHHVFASRHLLPDLEEGRVDALLVQDLEEFRRVFARPVIEGEGDDGTIARPVGYETGAAPGAPDRTDRAQAKRLGPTGRERFGAAVATLQPEPASTRQP